MTPSISSFTKQVRVASLIFSIAGFAVTGIASRADAQSSRPNVIVILTDDAGYNEFGFSAALNGRTTPFETPNLDRLAQQSMVARAGYASPLCTPSRAGLLTGLYQQRQGMEQVLGNSLGQTVGLDGNLTTIADRMKGLGYSTGMVGKWHVGYVNGVNRPNDSGFDEFFGFLSGNRGYFAESAPSNIMLRNTTNVEAQWRTQGDPSLYDPTRGRYLTDALGEESVDFINRHAHDEQPFFLYSAMEAPHEPFSAKQQDYDLFSSITDPAKRTNVAMNYALDRSVGMITDALAANGIDENTMVIFLNDNGGPAGKDNSPFKQFKNTTYEGGIRVPYMIKAPGVAPGIYDSPVTIYDITPTVVAAAGGSIPANETDGVNLLPYLSGVDVTEPHQELFFRYDKTWGVIKGGWKLGRQLLSIPYLQLFNLANDPRENVVLNLNGANAEKVAELSRDFTHWEATMAKPKYGTLGAMDRNAFDHFVFNGASGSATDWDAPAAWLDPAQGVPATMLTDDAYANNVLEFQVRADGDYTANNNMVRTTGFTYMLNEMRFTGEFTGATAQSATIQGNPVLFVKSLAGEDPGIRLDATGAQGSAAFTYTLSTPIQLLHNLQITGNGDQHFAVNGSIQDFDAACSVTKAGTSILTLGGTNTYRGATLISGGELRLSNPAAAIDGSSLVWVAPGAKLHLAGGLIRTPQLVVEPDGEFSLTGGTLQAAAITGNLTNAGGVFAGGPTVGSVVVQGDFSQTSGKLLLDVGATSQGVVFDSLFVTGAVQLGGTLDVDLFDPEGTGFTPLAGATYEIISAAGGVTGTFDQLRLPLLASNFRWQLTVGETNVVLKINGPAGSTGPAPYNAEGLAIWTEHFGLEGPATSAEADWNEDGNVDGSDFLLWQLNLTSLPPVETPLQSIPEPASAALISIALAAAANGTLRRRARCVADPAPAPYGW
jgi:autotransporter-associated beta strand protein